MRACPSRSHAQWLSVGLLTFAAACGPGPVRESAVHVIEIREMAFHPAEARVSVGDTVIWINQDFVPHTATAEGGTWTSPPLGQGERWSWVAVGAGPQDYRCDFHPTMEGRLTINDEGSRAPQGP